MEQCNMDGHKGTLEARSQLEAGVESKGVMRVTRRRTHDPNGEEVAVKLTAWRWPNCEGRGWRRSGEWLSSLGRQMEVVPFLTCTDSRGELAGPGSGAFVQVPEWAVEPREPGSSKACSEAPLGLLPPPPTSLPGLLQMQASP